jgi:hypothetical protein
LHRVSSGDQQIGHVADFKSHLCGGNFAADRTRLAPDIGHSLRRLDKITANADFLSGRTLARAREMRAE